MSMDRREFLVAAVVAPLCAPRGEPGVVGEEVARCAGVDRERLYFGEWGRSALQALDAAMASAKRRGLEVVGLHVNPEFEERARQEVHSFLWSPVDVPVQVPRGQFTFWGVLVVPNEAVADWVVVPEYAERLGAYSMPRFHNERRP